MFVLTQSNHGGFNGQQYGRYWLAGVFHPSTGRRRRPNEQAGIDHAVGFDRRRHLYRSHLDQCLQPAGLPGLASHHAFARQQTGRDRTCIRLLFLRIHSRNLRSLGHYHRPHWERIAPHDLHAKANLAGRCGRRGFRFL